MRIPTPPASANLSVCARAGRQEEFRGGRPAAAVGTGVLRGRPEGSREGPGTPEEAAGTRI